MTPPVRLLELRNTYKWGGGPDKTILLSAERHDPAKVGVTVAYVRGTRDEAFRVTERGRPDRFTYYELAERGKLDPAVLLRLRRIVRQHDINLIHGHDYKSDLFAYLLAKSLPGRRIRLLATAHAWVMLGAKGALYRRLDLACMRRFHALVAVSHATKAEMVQAGLAPEGIQVIHNAIDTDAWAPERAPDTFRAELGLEDSFPVVGYVGRIMPEKDLATWVRAAAGVAAAYPKAAFVLVGDGYTDTTQRELVGLAQELGFADRLHFTGYRGDLLKVYAGFDCFMMTSRREGLPNSLLEAMALGLPVVTTDVAGAKELVVDGATGFVRPQGDVEGLGLALRRLAGDEALRRRLGQAGRQRVVDEFSFTRRMQQIEALYLDVVSGAAGTRGT